MHIIQLEDGLKQESLKYKIKMNLRQFRKLKFTFLIITKNMIFGLI
jgi:hypothetical protein